MTSWLSGHPSIFMSPKKEPHFFDTDQRRRTTSLSDYERLFDKARHNEVVGEASVFYLFSHEAIPNIINYNPESRFLVMLRNPIDMLISLHRFYLFLGREDVSDLWDAWALNESRRRGLFIPRTAWDAKRMVYGDVCSVGEQIERMLLHIRSEKVLFVFLEDVKNKPRIEYLRVLNFLEVSDDGRCEFFTQNPAKSVRFAAVARFRAFAFNYKKKLGLRRSTGILNFIQKMNTIEGGYSEDNKNIRRLLHEFFQDDISKIQSLTGRDLSHWA